MRATPGPKVLDLLLEGLIRAGRIEPGMELPVPCENWSARPLATSSSIRRRGRAISSIDRRMAAGRFAQGEHLEVHAHGDDLGGMLPTEVDDGGAAVVLHADEAVALEHAQGLAHGHLADLELLGEGRQPQAAVHFVPAAEDAGAQLLVDPVRLGREGTAEGHAALLGLTSIGRPCGRIVIRVAFVYLI